MMKNSILKSFRSWSILAVFLSLISVLSFIPVEAAPIQPTDISKHWAKKDVSSAVYEQWVYMEGNKFKPDKPATREEVMWMLIGALKPLEMDKFSMDKKADLSKFKDKPSSWAAGRFSIAVGNGLIKGYPDRTIKAKAPITRAEFSVLISRLIDEKAPAGFLPFWDAIPAWAEDGIKKAHMKGIVNGYPNRAFEANKNVTKAEALVMIKRWKDNQVAYLAKISNEFKEIKRCFNSNVVISNSSQLYYYEDGIKKDSYNSDIFNIFEAKYGFTLYINRKNFKDENEAVYKNVLKVFYPTSYETVYSEILQSKKTSSTVIEKTYDGKSFSCKSDLHQTTVDIGK